MTAKRDFKRRVRQRQARTGESYVTARRRVLAGRPERRTPAESEAAPSGAATPRFQVGDPVQVTEGTFAGFRATIEQVRSEPPELTVAVSMSGQSASVALAVAQVERVPPGTESEPPPELTESPTLPGTGAEADLDAPRTAQVAERDRPATADPPNRGISVVELVDVTEEGRRFGFACRVLMFPALVERIPPARVLGRLRDLLIATVGDPETAALAGLALTGQKPPPRRASMRSYQDLGKFLQRARAGLGGTLDDGSTLAFHVADGDGIVPILCVLSAQDTAIELSAIEDVVPARWEPLSALLEEEATSELAERRLKVLMRARAVPLVMPRPKLFLLHDGKRYTITQDELVIGRSRTAADLVIHDESGMLSRRHAAVIRRAGSYYLKDLGSSNGVIYKGMRIDNKRIDEGDVFVLAGHEVAFTFLDE